jgi:hypothetical protein
VGRFFSASGNEIEPYIKGEKKGIQFDTWTFSSLCLLIYLFLFINSNGFSFCVFSLQLLFQLSLLQHKKTLDINV